MADHALALRKGIIAALKANSTVAAIVGARVYEESPAKPTWPFIRYGFPIVTPLLGDCWSGENHDLTIHVFARGPGSDLVWALAKAVKDALDEIDVAMAGDAGVLILQWSQSSVLRDTPEASDYHAVVQFAAATAEIVA